jgi:gliding motility-associated-like protein
MVIIGETVPLYYYSDVVGVYGYWNPSVFLSCTECTNPVCVPLTSTDYIICITDSICFDICDTVRVRVIEEYSLDVPSAFTPDGDGVNDVIFVRGWGIKDVLEFRIYNRWGQEIFFTDDIHQGWDGTFKGSKQNIDTYSYFVKVRFYDNSEAFKKGNITLLR